MRPREVPIGARIAAVAVFLLSIPLFLGPADVEDEAPTILGVPIPDVPGLDLAVHALVFAALAAALALGWPRVGALHILLALLTYGAATELAQQLVPGRSASALDWLADAAGALAGVWAGRARHRR